MPTWSLGLILQVNEVLSASPLMGSPSDDHYLDWVRQNVFTNPSLMEINNKKMNAVRQNWARKNQAEQERKLVAWVERLWIKWLQSHMKYLRRLKDSRQQPTHSTPAPVDKNPSPTSPLPNIRQLFPPVTEIYSNQQIISESGIRSPPTNQTLRNGKKCYSHALQQPRNPFVRCIPSVYVARLSD
jgi:hypothetical protein